MHQRPLPWIALFITVIIWAGYLVAVRAAASQNLSPIDVGLLRSVPAALILLPLTLKRGIFPGGANWIDILCIGVIGSALFILLLTNGAHFAPVADIGVFAPSMLPVFAMLLAFLFLSAKFHITQYLGIAIIVFGALFVGGWEALTNAATGAWRGHLLFLMASFSWAIYTIRFRASGLSATDAALILVTWSSILLLPAALILGSGLFDIPVDILLVQLLLGLSAGLIANFTFLYAVQHIGPTIPAASAALVPVIATLGGWLFLNEPISVLKGIGILVVAVGVLLASGYFARSKSVAQN